MHHRFTRVLFLAMIASASASAIAQTAPAPSPPRIVVKSQDDLPRHSYPLSTTATAMLEADEATFNAFAAKVAADIEATLGAYQIDDPATRRRMLSTRLAYEMLSGRNEQALRTIALIRSLEQKPDAKLTAGLREEAVAKARIETGAASGPAYEAAYVTHYRAALNALPFAVAGTRLKENKGNIEINTPSIFRGVLANDYEPEVKTRGAIGDEGAAFLLRARAVEKIYWPVKPQTIDALRNVIAANTVVKPDIWAAREVTLGQDERLTPVSVAVWDTGVDAALFKGRMLAPIAKAPRGPGNPHGLSFDEKSRPATGVLRPLTAEKSAVYEALVSDFQGLQDSQAALDTPEAEALRAKLGSMKPSESAPYIENLDFFGDYQHGTHVAGIVARGNPAVRLGVLRETFYDGPNPPAATDESVARIVASMADVSTWLKANRIRIVNMSWINTPEGALNNLERHNIGKTAEERKALAARYFGAQRAAFLKVLADNPDTLFVSAAGNSNSDNAFEGSYPSSIVAPNLIIANAVDQAGDETSFTSNGQNVVVSANGYQVLSYVPGGRQIKASGTSMASPNVANLAAKLLAVNPKLTPGQVIALIRAGADASADGRRHLMNPKASMALLKAGRF